jgi:restriction system protein
MPAGQLIRESARRYRSSRQKEPQDDEASAVEEVESELIKQQSKTILEKAEEDARIGIDARLDELGPYQFQDLVAELLRAMGYYIRQIAPPGADGGLDILAFRDPLGIQPPHLKVQVKHRSTKMEPREVRELSGILHKETDAGLLVSSGGFTREAEREIAQSAKHMDKIDRDRLISLWTKHYEKISENGKKLLPLTPVYFLAPTEE